MRPIDSAGYASVTEGDAGTAPMLQWVPIAQLVVDDSYQRPIADQGRRNVQRIAERFRWSKFAPIVAAPVEGGLYAIIDGQHRTTAAHLRGIKQVPCMIVPVDRRGQAEAFGAINAATTRLTAVQLHKAALSAGDPAALAIQAACDAAGVVITHTSQIAKLNQIHGSAPDRTASVQAIGKLLGTYGVSTLVPAMRAIVVSTASGSLLRGVVIGAVASALHMQDQWVADLPRLLKAMEQMDLVEEVTKARVEALRRPQGDAGGLLRTAVVRYLSRTLGRSA